MSDEKELIPTEQQTIIFYDKPIIVVRLDDERIGVVLRFLCENLQIDTAGQVQTLVHQLSQLSKKPYATIYDDMKTAFRVAKYSDVPEDQWEQLERWFQIQIERARQRLK